MDTGDVRNAMGLSFTEYRLLCLGEGMHVASKLPEHLRAKGMADVVRQVADGAPVDEAHADVLERYL